MIRVTIWNEHYQDRGEEIADSMTPTPENRDHIEHLRRNGREVLAVHPNGINETLREILAPCEDMEITLSTQDMEDDGLSDALLDRTDVLVYWAHCLHDKLSDAAAERVRAHVLRGMGFVPLHSAHPSKPFQRVLGSSGSLKWRDGDVCRVWNTCPTHPIAQGIPESFELEEEEMYGEYFDIPRPDDVVFTSWFSGGEVLRSGCTWTRGYGRIFYFQPGHETNRSYFNPYVRKIIVNAVRYCAPVCRVDALSCPHATPSPEEIRLGKNA